MNNVQHKRIAIICHSHPSLSKGGSEVAAYSLFTGLRELDLNPILVTACAETDRARLALGSDQEFAIYYDANLYDHFYHLTSLDTSLALRKILKSENIGVANFHHFLHFGIGTLYDVVAHTDIDTFITLHEFLAICQNHGQMITNPHRQLCYRSGAEACNACFPAYSRQQFAIRKNYFLHVLCASKGLISPSQFLCNRFVEWGVNRNHMRVAENGLQGDFVQLVASSRGEDVPWVFGFFGQINPFKGIDTLLRAVEIVAKSTALSQRIIIRIHGNLIGQPESFVNHFYEMVEKYDFLSFMGPYENRSVRQLMSECDYILVPSSWWENSPVVIQEAYSVRKPVICTGIGGMAEKIVDGTSGLHFKLRDHLDLVRVLGLAADRNVYAKLSNGVPAVADAKGMALDYLEIISYFQQEVNFPEL